MLKHLEVKIKILSLWLLKSRKKILLPSHDPKLDRG